MAKILIAEDDVDISGLIRRICEKSGLQAAQAFSGTEAALRLKLETFDMMILDLMLPGMTGEELLEKVRMEKRLEIPVLVLSAKAALTDKVQLLNGGADDYMTKPFEPEELLARINACLRRAGRTVSGQPTSASLSYKKLCIHPASRRATVNDRELILTPHEYEILFLLVQSPEKVFSREALYEQVWQGGYYGEDNTVNVHVSNLRKKLAALDADNEYIKTVWGIGFKMV